MELKVKVEGYGKRFETNYDGVVLKVTSKDVWLDTEFGKQRFRLRDGKKVGDSIYGGFQIKQADLKRVPGRKG